MSYDLNKGLAGFDRTHTLQISHYYQLPFGKGHKWLNHGFAAQVFGGFQIGGIISRYSGLPFSIGSNSSLNAGGQSQSADQINTVVAIYGGHDANHPYFDGTAFTNPVTNGLVHLGTTGRNILRGPGFLNINQNVSRTFGLGEKFKLQFLGEAFNLFNHPSFANPGSTFNAPTLNADGSVRSYNGYSTISATVSSARQLQVGAKITF